MIDYIYVLDEDRVPLGIIDTAESIIWERSYYSVGNVEVYTAATPKAVGWIKPGRYFYRGDIGDAAIIETVNISFEESGALMITATGRNIKSILNRRLIVNYLGNSITPTVIHGNVEDAVRELVRKHIIDADFNIRNIDFIKLGPDAGLPDIIIGEGGYASVKQTSYANLLEYTDGLLEQYKMGAKLVLNPETGDMYYSVYRGADRSRGNTDGNDPIIFSQEFDSLAGSSYAVDQSAYKNVGLIGGAGEGSQRFFVDVGGADYFGMDRREVFIDASSQSKTYESGGEQHEYDDDVYEAMLITAGMQKMVEYQETESFAGEVELAASPYQLGEDVDLGDLVTVEDNQIGVYINTRIVQTTEVQDDNGYLVTLTFGV